MITTRDLMLFRKLSDYGMLSTKQIGTLVFNSIASTTVLRRLRLLESGFYVKRISGLESQEMLWVLADRGSKTADVEVPKRHWSKNMLEHDFKLLSLRLALEASGIAHDWSPEHVIRANVFRQKGFRAAKEKLIPDGLMGIEVDGYRHSVAVELELNMKNERRYEQTFSRYSGKSSLHAIWYVTPTKGIMEHVHRSWRKLRTLYAMPNLYLSYLDEVMEDPLEARLLTDDDPREIGKMWTPKIIEVPAHTPAQRVSGRKRKKGQGEFELSLEDHTPISEVFAC